MRSGIIASLLESIGFKVLQVEGGYKSFRNYVLDNLQDLKLKPKVICLYGLTCTGKTKLLEKLPNSLDLEALAQHRSSLLGAVGLKPNSQKRFENLLLHRLQELQHNYLIFIEGESRKIGSVEVPISLFKAMKKGKNFLITRSFDLRVQECLQEYFSDEKNVAEIKELIPRLRELLSNKRKEEIV